MVIYVAFVLFSVTKRYRYVATSQLLQVIMQTGYMVVTLYIIYFLKRCQMVVYDDNAKIITAEIWILIEAITFFMRIFAGIFFLLTSYLIKSKPFVRHSFFLENDDNPWNNKNTEDFLRHLKVEYFLVTGQIVNIIVPLIICYANNYGWIEIYKFGPRDFSKSQILVILAIIPRFFLLSLSLYVAYTGMNFANVNIRKSYGVSILLTTISFIVMLIYRFVVLDNAEYEKQNAFITVWFPYEITLKILETIWYSIHAAQTMIPQDSVFSWLASALGGGVENEQE